MKPAAAILLTLLFLGLISFGDEPFAQKPPEPIVVGIIPIADIAPLFTALHQGYFKEEGLELRLTPLQGGAVILPAIAGGSLDIGFTNVVSLILAKDQGFDFVLIAGAVHIGEKANAILVKKDSGINSFRDLNGKKVAVNALNGVAWMYAREAVAKDGGDASSLNWFELPFPQMGAALLKGQVEAVSTPEPFITILQEEPMVKVLGYDMYSTNPGGVLAVFAATKRWVDKNEEKTGRFARALARGVEHINKNPKETRKIISQYANLSSGLAQRMRLALWKGQVTMSELDKNVELMVRHGLLKSKPDLKGLLYKTAAPGL